ncbi:MAG: DUF2335 domain-containing protein [Candidatus Cyclonatronum sp.]|uniref:DUF2335 domain-containing protein n=1 Tax=Cyclonatronum sp. TaxID=3024185 RepID=UPI0025BA8DF6|nr:DUF2335 domain-containing protein [Cyclonatronum sp.]MCH8487554.1 DUF2335 domain-containing protein [Cyclonatronum sp.]
MPRSKSDSQDRITLAQFSGPLPPSQEFANYENILPGAADRILKMAEIEQEARIKSQRSELRMLFVSHIIGQVFAFLLGLIGIGAGFYLILNGHDVTGLGVLVGSLAAIVGAFIYKQRKE